jgi:flavin reductase (DIM6/NTAB) family NADH-FMN oxidoreductase RutF
MDTGELALNDSCASVVADSFATTDFRRTLGSFATGVTVITVRGADQKPIGMACNSFSSLSLNPPLILWSLDKGSRNHAAIRDATFFAVHVLEADQEHVCKQFSARDGDRFADMELEAGMNDLPLLKHYLARFQCEMHAQHDAGDHTVIIGHVRRLDHSNGNPLIFYRGALFAFVARTA